MKKLPKNTPETIFLDLGFESDNTDKEDFNECDEVTWSETNATGDGIEFVRKDVYEKKVSQKLEYEKRYWEAMELLYDSHIIDRPITHDFRHC